MDAAVSSAFSECSAGRLGSVLADLAPPRARPRCPNRAPSTHVVPFRRAFRFCRERNRAYVILCVPATLQIISVRNLLLAPHLQEKLLITTSLVVGLVSLAVPVYYHLTIKGDNAEA